jgi:hypothetical protein
VGGDRLAQQAHVDGAGPVAGTLPGRLLALGLLLLVSGLLLLALGGQHSEPNGETLTGWRASIHHESS